MTLTDKPCRNCGDETPGRYCRNCGQKKVEHRASVAVLLAEAARDQFSLTAELPRTLKALFLHPGFLAQEYSAGRIARYVHPLRLYLAASLLFFLTLSITSGTRRGSVLKFDDTVADSVAADSSGGGAVTDSVAADSSGGRAAVDTTDSDPFNVNTPWESVNRRIEERVTAMRALPDGVAQQRLGEFMMKRAPLMVFILVPLFALMLQAMYWRPYYAEHFVFALHVHAFTFLMFTGIILIQDLLPMVAIALFLWLAVYPLFALRRAYGQNWIVTFLKYLVLGVAYNLLLAAALVVEVVIGILLI